MQSFFPKLREKFQRLRVDLNCDSLVFVPSNTRCRNFGFIHSFHFRVFLKCFFPYRNVLQPPGHHLALPWVFVGHRGKLEYMLVGGTDVSGGLRCMTLSRGKDRAQCAVVFTAPLLKRKLSREQRWRNTDLRQMIKTQGSTMGLTA